MSDGSRGSSDRTSSMTNRFDVAIVGAGPAGAWLACRLARAGVHVGLFDASHPREKPCGGAVTGRALQRVASALATRPLAAVTIDAATFEQAGVTPATIPLPRRAPGAPAMIVAARARFDATLLAGARDAGATLVSCRVTDVGADASGPRVAAGGRSWPARWIVGADGANSLVRRRFARAFRREQLSIATGFFAFDTTSRDVVVRFLADPPGYLWAFPRPDHFAVGVCAQADAARVAPLREAAAAWIRSRGLSTRLRPYSWPIPSLGASDFERERPAGPGWLLVGDAAGLVDPLTREGIFYALESADLAADALLADTADAHVTYARALRRHVYPELALAARWRTGFFRPRFTRLMIERLAVNSRLRRVMADLIAGEQPYRTLRRRLLGTLDSGGLWQLLTDPLRPFGWRAPQAPSGP